MEIHDQIRIAREAKGWTKERLADELGVSKQAVTNWETPGSNIPRVQRWVQLEKALGTKLHATPPGKGTEAEQIGVTKDELSTAIALATLPKSIREAIGSIVSFMSKSRTTKPPVVITASGKNPQHDAVSRSRADKSTKKKIGGVKFFLTSWISSLLSGPFVVV